LALAAALYIFRKQPLPFAFPRYAPFLKYTWPAAVFLLTLGAVSCGKGAAGSTFSLSCNIPTGEVTLKYAGSCVASGGKAPYTYAVDSSSPGSIPPGLTLNATTGTITGTPTQQITSDVIINATDSSSSPQTASETVSFVITGAPIKYGTVTVTATSGNIVNTATIAVAESL
jgi:hypothetical protein